MHCWVCVWHSWTEPGFWRQSDECNAGFVCNIAEQSRAFEGRVVNAVLSTERVKHSHYFNCHSHHPSNIFPCEGTIRQHSWAGTLFSTPVWADGGTGGKHFKWWTEHLLSVGLTAFGLNQLVACFALSLSCVAECSDRVDSWEDAPTHIPLMMLQGHEWREGWLSGWFDNGRVDKNKVKKRDY